MKKLMIIGFILVGLGFASGVAEGFFHGGKVDENGVLQESFFLPLSFLLSQAGAALIALAIILRVFPKKKKK